MLVKKIIITGDLNADPSTMDGTRLSELSEANGLTIHVHEPTRITMNSQTILDQFLSNIPQMFKHVTVSDGPISSNDHCTIVADLLFRKRKMKAYKRTMWDFNSADFDLFRSEINTANWEICFAQNDIDKATANFTSKLLSIAKYCIPNKTVCVRPNDKPWYNNHLRRLCRKRRRLHKIAKHLNTPNSWAAFRKCRNQYFNEVKEAKLDYENNKYSSLAKECTSSKKYWSIMRKLLKSNDGYETIPPIETDTEIITDDLDKANAFNDFFLKASSLDNFAKETPPNYLINDGGLCNISISIEDVCDQLKCLDTSKSYGPDGLSPRLLKEGGIALAKPLKLLFEISLLFALETGKCCSVA